MESDFVRRDEVGRRAWVDQDGMRWDCATFVAAFNKDDDTQINDDFCTQTKRNLNCPYFQLLQ